MARPVIRRLPVYSPGLGTEEIKKRYGVAQVIKLASNENPLGPSPLAERAILDESRSVNLYPDGACSELREKLSGKLKVDGSCLIFGNGADEVIDFIFYAFFEKGDRVVMGDPTFSSYFISGMAMDADIVYVPLRDHRHHVEEMIKKVDKATKAVFVGTPHNPTGSVCTRDELERLMEELPDDVMLIWDEAYREYVEDPLYPESIPYIESNPNLVVLRTFSKIYGLAGLRVGYGVAHPDVVGMLERVRPPFNVNRLAQKAAAAALDDYEHQERSRRVNSEGKAYLAEQLSGLGLEPLPTEANFILVGYEGVTEDLFERLLERGIIVRDGSTLGYPGYVRVTIGTMRENRLLVGAVAELIEG